MRSIAAAIVFCFVGLTTGHACGKSTTEDISAAKPKVFALVAAFGSQFSFVSEVPRTGSHLPPYRRSTTAVQNDILNRVVLHSLDKAVATIAPGSKRIYMTLPSAQMDGVAPSERETVAISRVVAALENMPQRLEWDRILVATPAYRGLELRGLAGRLDGFGLFSEPLCQGCGSPFDPNPATPLRPESRDGDALTSGDETIQAKTYIAPFSYVDVWVLDPKTLAVLDKQERFESQKLAEPGYKPMVADIEKYLASRIYNLIELSIGDAVMHSEINDRQGKVEVGEPQKVDPGAGKK